MKKQLILLFPCLLTLMSCGGGDEKITTWQIPSDKECELLLKEPISVNDISLTNQLEVDIQLALEVASATHAHQLFLRNKEEFMSWVKDGHELSIATHETNHSFNKKLAWCNGSDSPNYFLNGNYYDIGYNLFHTAHYSIVEQTIPEHLKQRSRYQYYIEGLKGANGNKFHLLLDELVAYIGDGGFQLDYIKSGQNLYPGSFRPFSTLQVDGAVDMMLYVQYYLKSARLNYPESYVTIDNEETIAALQALWHEAEAMLTRAYPYLVEQKVAGEISIFFDNQNGNLSALDILKAVYSDDALFELDELNIQHSDYNDWQSSYLSFDN